MEVAVNMVLGGSSGGMTTVREQYLHKYIIDGMYLLKNFLQSGQPLVWQCPVCSGH